jgi:hypothetical protein
MATLGVELFAADQPEFRERFFQVMSGWLTVSATSSGADIEAELSAPPQPVAPNDVSVPIATNPSSVEPFSFDFMSLRFPRDTNHTPGLPFPPCAQSIPNERRLHEELEARGIPGQTPRGSHDRRECGRSMRSKNRRSRLTLSASVRLEPLRR